MWRVLGWVSVVMSAVLVATSLTAYAAFRKLEGNIQYTDVLGLLGKDRPEKPATEAENILLIGSDTRTGQGDAKYGRYIQGARSDTLILLHLSPKHDKALLVSFPRDSIVQLPSCQQENGTMSQPRVARINAAFSTGGPACSWKTIESLTGIHIDHFVEVDFAGFKRMVDALGGVEVCLPEPVHDIKSGLNLSAGPHVVEGEQALAFVRVRHNIGNGSDLGRIKRQQKFMGSMVKKATSTGLLLNPPRLYSFLDAATKSITTDSELGVDGLKRIADSVKGLNARHVTFLTVPVHDTGDGATVAWNQPDANQLFAAIRNDSQPPEKTKPGGERSSEPSVPPGAVHVRVLNGTTVQGLAARAAGELQDAGFHIAGVGNADASTYTHTVVRYGPGGEEAARTLASAVPGAQTQPDPTLTDGSGTTGASPTSGGAVMLVIGGDWGGVHSVSADRKTPSPIPSGVDTITADQNPCAGQ